MTKTVYFVADANGKMDWLTRFEGVDGMRDHYEAFLAGVGALAMGADTYLFLLSHGGAWPYVDRPTFVFTRRQLSIPAGADVRLVNGRVATARNAMLRAAADRDLWLVGGGKLAAQFAEAGAIDEIHRCVAPTVLGAGAPRLPAGVGAVILRTPANDAICVGNPIQILENAQSVSEIRAGSRINGNAARGSE